MTGYEWPILPLPATLATAGVLMLAVILLLVSHRFDTTGGLLTISLVMLSAFVGVTYTTMLYDVKQTAIMDILVGALATSVGAIVAFWMTGGRK